MSDLVERLRRECYCVTAVGTASDHKCRNCMAADEIERLTAWKAEALAVEATWDIQAIGKMLNLPLGASIRAEIGPAIERLTAALEAENDMAGAALRAAIQEEREACALVVDRLTALGIDGLAQFVHAIRARGKEI